MTVIEYTGRSGRVPAAEPHVRLSKRNQFVFNRAAEALLGDAAYVQLLVDAAVRTIVFWPTPATTAHRLKVSRSTQGQPTIAGAGFVRRILGLAEAEGAEFRCRAMGNSLVCTLIEEAQHG